MIWANSNPTPSGTINRAPIRAEPARLKAKNGRADNQRYAIKCATLSDSLNSSGISIFGVRERKITRITEPIHKIRTAGIVFGNLTIFICSGGAV